jgi:hypothetical protein
LLDEAIAPMKNAKLPDTPGRNGSVQNWSIGSRPLVDRDQFDRKLGKPSG